MNRPAPLRQPTRWNLPSALLWVLLGLPVATGCAGVPSDGTPEGGPDGSPEASNDPEVRQPAAGETPEDPDRLTELVAPPESQKTMPFHEMLLKADRALDGYVLAVNNSSRDRPDKNAAGLESYLRRVAKTYQSELEVAAVDGDNPSNRPLAVALLGFAPPDQDVLGLIVQGAMSDDPDLRNNALFGLAILRHPETPHRVMTTILADRDAPQELRVNAAWALYEVQEAIFDKGAIHAAWRQLLARPQSEVDPLVAVQALRGLGLARNRDDLPLIMGWLEHPGGRVRSAAIIGTARIGSVDASERLIAMLSDEEPNANVRLHARKALQRLAGGTDRGYDQREWRKVFQFMAEEESSKTPPGSPDGGR